MDLFESQGKRILREVGIPVPEGEPATTAREAGAAARRLGGSVAVKAQVQAGGRGKAGGIRIVHSPEAAEEAAATILGMTIGGRPVSSVLVEQAAPIDRELYAAILLDRRAKMPLAMLSAAGGMEVEAFARSETAQVGRVHVDPLAGWYDYKARRLLFASGVSPELLAPITSFFSRLYQAFTCYAALLVEVNPLVVTKQGSLLALDAKVTLDNNALALRPELAAFAGECAPDSLESMAAQRGLAYVKLEGEIGVLGNGAGLVMSSLDLVAAAGGRPANFLDVGGGAQADRIAQALEILSSDPSVRSILVNIFGGLTRCDEVARGLLQAVDKLRMGLPVVVRLEGTNAEVGRRIITEAALPALHQESSMTSAARRAVELALGAAVVGTE